jgi:hypothetical protein
MERAASRAVAVALVIGSPVALPGLQSGAHTHTHYFIASPIPGLTTKWPFNRVDGYFDASYPNEQMWRDRVQEAGSFNWPRSLGLPPVYYWFAPGGWTYSGNCVRSDNQNGVFWKALPNDWLAVTQSCRYHGHWYFNMTFDRDSTLWPGNDPAPSTDWFDLEAIATHEWGHAYGWTATSTNNGGHLPDGEVGVCDSSLTRHTMCRQIPRQWLRQPTPEAHDLHTTDWGYPPPP